MEKFYKYYNILVAKQISSKLFQNSIYLGKNAVLEAFNIVWLEKLEVCLGITVKSLSGKNDRHTDNWTL